MGEQGRIGLAAGLCLSLIVTSTAAEPDPAFGRWVVDSGKAVIELYSCGDQACGRLVWLKNPYDDAGELKRDVLNPDPETRDRPLCGLELVTGLRREANGAWESGSIYSTRDGQTYGLDIKLLSADELSVRGYLGVSLLGKTQTWNRDEDQRPDCSAITQAAETTE
ncbi:MAG: DUF2147 domain-containing protein [Pseudomonadota bacterium]